jgi:nicotinate dehydrogenase subunit A
MPVTFTLNGLAQVLDLPPETLLIHALRDELLLHGAKYGCGQEQCGACVVLIDGQPAYSCTTTVTELEGRRLDTVEGLADEHGELDPVQQAFIELNAAQCGYCSAGMIMRIKALLNEHAHPSRADVCRALDGHLCRCGAQPRILDAVERAIAIRQVNRR